MGSVEIPEWLERLPLAPEFHPTDTEFADPIAYISKIEKKASAFGICKIVPPLPKPSKRYVFYNLNKSLSKCPELGDDVDVSGVGLRSSVGDGANDGEFRPVFTTRHQEVGQDLRRMKGVEKESPHLGACKQVWQSGGIYTLEQFESKSKAFAKSMLGAIKDVNPLVIEALFWKTASEKPIYVEYANDVPGSAFGEPEGQFRYFRRRRRKRASYQSYRKNRESSESEQNKLEGLKYSQDHEVQIASVDHETTPTSEKDPRSPTNSSTSLPEETVRPTKKRSTSTGTDMEGTAGWKLSNSPWNLQVIARSPGSLTRFMPDDIPGVTSPMIYIGMLFSWFAWHVEDHELHSMNFLHAGSPKTWYAVPGEYAHTFEEVIRVEAYGGNVDRLAALSLLGEKTTLLSPEVVVSSNIPCCRLIQNPGEFVITFPRAYHVGFSHGFNCGEAANFGTPQWLEFAKEAAVRRAAMNYLPMLSHQQLLYLLTMSFVSRVPRALLPGVRCSRLRDRQREDRELLVKKAFLEDMLKENSLLSALLGRNAAFRAVEWNPEMLPCTSRDKEIQLPRAATDNDTTQMESVSHVSHNNDAEKSDLFKEMSLYMEKLNDLYVYDDDDLSGDFQIDSGTLACVACGILGFPFMCVIQPSEAASVELWSKEEAGTSRLGNDHADTRGLENMSASDDGCSLPRLSPPTKDIPTLEGWSTSCKFLRPRIFCMEHGIQIKKLFRSKGETNMLIICHSDYRKIKAHAAAIAVEIGVSYDYHEVPIQSASQEELNLIDLAIDSEDYTECEEDWTSVVGINLRYCVRTRKHSPSKQIQHALALGCLFSEKDIVPNLSSMKWQSRRSRSKMKLNQPAESKPCGNSKTNKDELLLEEPGVAAVGKEKRLIQYTRKKSKKKIDNANSVSQGEPRNENLDLPCVGVSEVRHVVQALDASDGTRIETVGSDFATTSSSPSAMEQIDYMNIEEPKKYNNGDDANDAPTMNSSELSHQMKDFGGTTDDEISHAAKCSSPFVSSSNGGSSLQNESQTTETSIKTESHNIVSERQPGAAGDDLTHKLGNHSTTTEESCGLPEICPEESSVVKEVATGSEDIGKLVMGDLELISQPFPGCAEETSGVPVESCAPTNSCCEATAESKNDAHQEFQNIKGHEDNIALRSPNQREANQPNASSKESEVAIAMSAGGDLCLPLTSDVEVRIQILATEKSSTEKLVPDFTVQDQPLPVSVDCSEVQRDNDATEDLSGSVILDTKLERRIKSSSGLGANEVLTDQTERNEELVSGHVLQTDEGPTTSLIQSCSRAEETCADGKLLEVEEAQTLNRSSVLNPISTAGKGKKRKNEAGQISENELNCSGFIRSPCEGLRPRAVKTANGSGDDIKESIHKNLPAKGPKKTSSHSLPPERKEVKKRPHQCDVEGCRMSFHTKTELLLHKRNRCPHEGCRKRFSSHKYAMIHQRVHEDDRPLKCPWKGCSMTFKWAWARTEHIRVHTGEKPYQCKVEGCGRSFRFVSDFSRHRRRTGHYTDTHTSP